MNLELELRRILQVSLGTTLSIIGLTYFIIPSNLVAGGLTGYAILIQTGLAALGLSINLGLLVALVNIPVMILGFVGVSRKFVYYSLYSISLQVVLLAIIGTPDAFFGADVLAGSIIGGLIVGVGAATTLKAGASQGGLDVVSQYISLRYQISIGYVSVLANAGILIIAFFFLNPTSALYTLVMYVVANVVVDNLHTAYKRVRIEIVSSHGDEVKKALLATFIRGITMIEGTGAFTGAQRKVMVMITQTHEVYDIQKTILSIDPDAFISMSPVRLLAGKFNRVVMK